VDAEKKQQESARKFDALLTQKLRVEFQLEAIKEEMAKEQGKHEAYEEIKKECVNDTQPMEERDDNDSE
jgi:hypothetical protein